MSEIIRRLRRLRAQMRAHGVAAYLVPSTDPHQSEFVPECWQRRKWLSGFSGSMGDLVVTQRRAALWVDGRYHIQAEAELRGSTIELQKVGQAEVPTIERWLVDVLRRRQAVGVDPRLLSRGVAAKLENALRQASIQLTPIEENLVDAIWSDRPSRPEAPIHRHGTRYAGASVSTKLKWLRKAMKAGRFDAHLLTALDCIAWLFNIRSEDVPFTPLVIANALITSERATLYADLRKAPPAVTRALARQVELRPYDAFGKSLAKLNKVGRRVLVDEGTVNLWILEKLGRCNIVASPSPIWSRKAAKNSIERQGIRRAHQRDGVAMVKFLSWLTEALADGQTLTEIDAQQKLSAFRAQGDLYRGDSFATISGYGAHGAIVHYSATPASVATLKRKGIFLIDSGGQYLDGTTDITRTVLLGKRATGAQRDRFTRVLKGHIALARAVFPAGVAGQRLDTLARAPLWRAGLDYAHGTGHGVGCYLGVHEGPQSISPTHKSAPLEEGNVLSNEPGFYLEGQYGIRIENLMLAIDAKLGGKQPFLRFETLTLCPIDRALIDSRQLDTDERRWVDTYHRRVYTALRGDLDAGQRRWLRGATRPL